MSATTTTSTTTAAGITTTTTVTAGGAEPAVSAPAEGVPTTIPRWLPLESNPEVLNPFVRRMGLPADWGFADVFGLDPVRERLLAAHHSLISGETS